MILTNCILALASMLDVLVKYSFHKTFGLPVVALKSTLLPGPVISIES